MISIPGYKIIEQLGQGGMASVYLAIQQSVDRKVAIKIMSPSLAADPSFSERFLKEARMAHLTHPHIVTVYDAGEVDQQNFIVMEYAGGGNLADRITKGISISDIITIIKQIADALNYAHQQGIIHRDVKSENILLKDDDNALLVDFGIAKAVTSGTQLTMVGAAIGSPNYMSPEQARGLSLDGRSDLYSLGIVLFECLTGRKPFDSYDTYVIGLKHISDPLPKLPEDLIVFQPIINKLLAKLPEQRYETAAIFVKALDEVTAKLKSEKSDLLDALNSQFIEQASAAVADSATMQETSVDEAVGDHETLMQATQIRTTIDEETKLNESLEATVVMPDVDKTRIANKLPTKRDSNRNIGLVIIILVLVGASGTGLWLMLGEQKTPVTEVTTKESQANVDQSSTESIVLTEPNMESIESSSETAGEVIMEEPAVETPTDKVSQAQNKKNLITKLLEQADIYMQRKQYSTPKEANALSLYGQVLVLDPANLEAQEGLNRIVETYYKLAKSRMQANKIQAAKRFVKKGLGINPEHAGLLTLNKEILAKAKSITKTVKTIKSIFSEDAEFFNIEGIHKANTKQNIELLAKRSLYNNLYLKLLKQCNISEAIFTHSECKSLYQRYYNDWPVPGLALSYSQNAESSNYNARFRINRDKTLAALNQLNRQATDIFQKPKTTHLEANDKLVLANYELAIPILALAGLPIIEGVGEKLNSILSDESNKIAKLNSIDQFSRFVQKHFAEPVSHVSMFNENSLEVTPFDHELTLWIKDSLPEASTSGKGGSLYARYQVQSSGDIRLDLWLFGSGSKIEKHKRIVLDDKIVTHLRKKNMLSTEILLPERQYKKMHNLSVDIALSNQASFALLTTGNKETLQVKMEHPGFYYLAVHVIRENEQYSYLLPLNNVEPPFIQIIDGSQEDQYVPLGEFTVTLPLGVEIIQLIGSNVNLSKYLPSHDWDEKRQHFIIVDSVGNVSTGINAVREAVNRIETEALNPDAHWQEKFLVTTILE